MHTRLQTWSGELVGEEVWEPQSDSFSRFLRGLYVEITQQEKVFLGSIDPYDDTIFNSRQIPRFLEEWDWLMAKAAPHTPELREFLAKVRQMAIRCKEDILQLKFIGD